jgi:hypothetical protein
MVKFARSGSWAKTARLWTLPSAASAETSPTEEFTRLPAVELFGAGTAISWNSKIREGLNTQKCR